MKEAIKISQEICFTLLKEIKQLCEEHQLTYWIDGGTLLGAKRHGGFIPWDDDIDICFPIKDYLKILDLLAKKYKSNSDRLLYFHNKDFPSWSDYFADLTYLGDGILPLKVDLIPVKLVKNTNEAIAMDESWFEVACLYMKGYNKHPENVRVEHQRFLPTKGNLQEQKRIFFKEYFDYLVQESVEIETKKLDFVLNYSFNDIYAGKSRRYYRSDEVFPLHKLAFENEEFPVPNEISSYLESLYGPNFMSLPPENKRVPYLTFVQENPFPPNEISFLMKWLYHYKFKNLALHFKNRNWIKIYRVKNLGLFSLRLLVQGKIKLLKAYWKYNFSFIQKDLD